MQWFRNRGKKGAPLLDPARPVEVAWTGTAPKPKWIWWTPSETELATQWRTIPYAIDWNKISLSDK